MELRWTQDAARDLERISDYLFENAPKLIRTLYHAPEVLQRFPQRGRPGKKAGTRELVLWPLPYIVIYRIKGEAVHIVRILHGAQNWP